MSNNNTDKSIEQWLWDAACSTRGAKDAPKYKDYILPLLHQLMTAQIRVNEIDIPSPLVG